MVSATDLASVKAQIRQYAELDPDEYAIVRREAATLIGWSLSELDRSVKRQRDILAKEAAAAEKAQRKANPPPDAKAHDPRPVIRIEGGELPAIVDAAEACIIASGQPIYQRGNLVVRPIKAKLEVSDGTAIIGDMISPIAPEHAVEVMTRAARWQKFSAASGNYSDVDAPDKVARTWLKREGLWNLPVLTGFVAAPTLRPDGSILQDTGYDAATGIIFLPQADCDFPSVPVHPTKHDASVAIDILGQIIEDFPFVEDQDRSVALSGILTALVRNAMPAVPMHAFSAPAAGTGKSMLVDLANVIAYGHRASVMALGQKEEETEKRIGAAMISGSTVICIDNISAPLTGDFLCSVLTQDICLVRDLGFSRLVKVPNKACLFATGNNLTLKGDIFRRTLLCSLDAACERPDLRQFDADPVEEAMARRGELAIAGLTILRAYIVAGRPQKAPMPIGNFGAWSRLVREALMWLGCSDPVLTMEKSRENDPAVQAHADLMVQWASRIGNEEITTARLIQLGNDRSDSLYGGSGSWSAPELRDALLRVSGSDGGISSMRLGKYLGSIAGRIVAGMRIRRSGVTDGSVRWTLDRV